jgi:alkylation response protein AidB-like acyl-CoA dehydrogenase
VRERRQFGVPVGSFQAVKHRLADVALRLALAGPAVLAAGWSAATGNPAQERALAAAAVLATEAATEAAKAALQCHGAIGYTVEYDLHLYAKRVWALTAADPGAEHHLARLADTLDLPEGVRR